MKKRFLAVILVLALVLCLLPTAAFAAGESGIQLGTAGLKANDEIYFGDYSQNNTTCDVPWIVMNTSGFLLSKYLLATSPFRTESAGYYKDGALNSKMDALYNGTGTSLFTSQERVAITAKTNLSCVDGQNDDTSSPVVSTAHLYPLSFNEAAALTWGSDTLKAPYITNQSGSAGWWLRSSLDADGAFCVDVNGIDVVDPVSNNLGARPAFNLDLSKVLFTSAAAGGKTSGTEGTGALNSNLTPLSTSKNTWKLTLLDNAAGSGRENFSVTTTTVSTTTAGGDVSIAYSGAKVGTYAAPEYISAMLVDGSGKVLHYGRLKSIAASGDAAGTQDITIPALSAGTYTLKIFNEQYNGDYNTDYSSAIKDVTLTVRGAAVSDATVSGTQNSAITDTDVALTLTNDAFKQLSANDNVSNWFTNLPAGLSAKIKTAVTAGDTTATVTISGTPAATSTAAMAITIPAAALAGGSDITVTANANAKWNIVAPTPSEPTVTAPTQNKTVTVVVGSTATMSVTAQNATGFQWYINRNDSNGFVAISGATSASYTTGIVALNHDGYQYYCIVSGAAGTTPAQSPTFALRVVEQPDIPATGDNSQPGLWLGIMLLAGAGLAGSMVMGRRKRRERTE